MPILQSSMSITQAILSGHDVHKAGSNHPPHTIWPPAESHQQQHTAKEHGHVNGNNNVSVPTAPATTNKECNGLSETNKADLLSQGRGEVNGILGSPDSASSDLPPSPMEGGVKMSQDYLPNGLAECSVTQRSKELFLHSMAEKAIRLNGVVHHMENGDIKISVSQEKMELGQECRVPQPGEKVIKVDKSSETEEVDAEKKLDLWQVNGLSGHGGAKGNHVTASSSLPLPLPHRDREQVVVFSKQTSMEEVSLDSTDSKLVVNGSGKAGDPSGGRPLFSPVGSHDSDLSCDSFASSIADSVSSDKHSSLAPHSFPKPATSAAPSPSPSPSTIFPEVPLVLAGTIPMSEAVNKRNKKKAAAAKTKAERPPPKSKKRKGGSASSGGAPDTQAAVTLTMEYMCEWAGCRR